MHRHRSPARRAHNNLLPVPIKLRLRHPHRRREILIRQRRVDDLTALITQEGRFPPARDGMPTVKEENSHEDILSFRSADQIPLPLRKSLSRHGVEEQVSLVPAADVDNLEPRLEQNTGSQIAS